MKNVALKVVSFEEAVKLSIQGTRVYAMNVPKEKTPTVKSFQRLTVKEAVGEEILLFIIEGV
jgi:hypothetical protein